MSEMEKRKILIGTTTSGKSRKHFEEYGCTAHNVVTVCKNNLLLKRQYRVIKKEV